MNLGGCESRETRRWGEMINWKWVAKDKERCSLEYGPIPSCLLLASLQVTEGWESVWEQG